MENTIHHIFLNESSKNTAIVIIEVYEPKSDSRVRIYVSDEDDTYQLAQRYLSYSGLPNSFKGPVARQIHKRRRNALMELSMSATQADSAEKITRAAFADAVDTITTPRKREIIYGNDTSSIPARSTADSIPEERSSKSSNKEIFLSALSKQHSVMHIDVFDKENGASTTIFVAAEDDAYELARLYTQYFDLAEDHLAPVTKEIHRRRKRALELKQVSLVSPTILGQNDLESAGSSKILDEKLTLDSSATNNAAPHEQELSCGLHNFVSIMVNEMLESIVQNKAMLACGSEHKESMCGNVTNSSNGVALMPQPSLASILPDQASLTCRVHNARESPMDTNSNSNALNVNLQPVVLQLKRNSYPTCSLSSESTDDEKRVECITDEESLLGLAEAALAVGPFDGTVLKQSSLKNQNNRSRKKTTLKAASRVQRDRIDSRKSFTVDKESDNHSSCSDISSSTAISYLPRNHNSPVKSMPSILGDHFSPLLPLEAMQLDAVLKRIVKAFVRSPSCDQQKIAIFYLEQLRPQSHLKRKIWNKITELKFISQLLKSLNVILRSETISYAVSHWLHNWCSCSAEIGPSFISGTIRSGGLSFSLSLMKAFHLISPRIVQSSCNLLLIQLQFLQNLINSDSCLDEEARFHFGHNQFSSMVHQLIFNGCQTILPKLIDSSLRFVDLDDNNNILHSQIQCIKFLCLHTPPEVICKVIASEDCAVIRGCAKLLHGPHTQLFDAALVILRCMATHVDGIVKVVLCGVWSRISEILHNKSISLVVPESWLAKIIEILGELGPENIEYYGLVNDIATLEDILVDCNILLDLNCLVEPAHKCIDHKSVSQPSSPIGLATPGFHNPKYPVPTVTEHVRSPPVISADKSNFKCWKKSSQELKQMVQSSEQVLLAGNRVLLFSNGNIAENVFMEATPNKPMTDFIESDSTQDNQHNSLSFAQKLQRMVKVVHDLDAAFQTVSSSGIST